MSGAVRFEFALPERKEDGAFSGGCFATRLHYPIMAIVSSSAIADLRKVFQECQLFNMEWSFSSYFYVPSAS